MSDKTTGHKPRDRSATLSADVSPEAQERFKERLRSQPIVQLRVSIFNEDTERPTDVEWHVFSWPGVTPEAGASLLDRVTQEIQGVRQRLQAEAFPDQLLDRLTRELEAIPRRLLEQGFPGRGGGWYKCSFCGKKQEQVHRLIAGPGGVYICDECINLCREIIVEEQWPPASPPPGNLGAGSEG